MQWPNDANTLNALAARLADELSPAGMVYLAEKLAEHADVSWGVIRLEKQWQATKKSGQQ